MHAPQSWNCMTVQQLGALHHPLLHRMGRMIPADLILQLCRFLLSLLFSPWALDEGALCTRPIALLSFPETASQCSSLGLSTTRSL